MNPTESELVDAWVTLALLKKKAIHGELVSRGFDTFTACGQAQTTVELELAAHHSLDMDRLYVELDERTADSHA